VRSWSTFDAWTHHEHTRIHKTHHGPDLGEATTFPLVIFFVISRRAYIQMSFCPKTLKLGIPKFSKLGLLWFWRPITFCVDLRLRRGLKKSFTFHWKLSKDMWQANCTQVNQGESWLLVIRNQIGSLTPNPSFGHNLFLKYSNGTCEPILKIYILRVF
jgi:hypothetical protein